VFKRGKPQENFDRRVLGMSGGRYRLALSMAIRRFSPFASTAKPKVVRTRGALDVAARYFVYKLYDATRRDRIQWVPLKGIDESQATIERAVQLGWAVLQGRLSVSLRHSEASLTEEGRRLARMGR
jgi:hypothetical protein